MRAHESREACSNVVPLCCVFDAPSTPNPIVTPAAHQNMLGSSWWSAPPPLRLGACWVVARAAAAGREPAGRERSIGDGGIDAGMRRCLLAPRHGAWPARDESIMMTMVMPIVGAAKKEQEAERELSLFFGAGRSRNDGGRTSSPKVSNDANGGFDRCRVQYDALVQIDFRFESERPEEEAFIPAGGGVEKRDWMNEQGSTEKGHRESSLGDIVRRCDCAQCSPPPQATSLSLSQIVEQQASPSTLKLRGSAR